jgi:hypothetical protein
MPKDWISAAEALERIEKVSGLDAARRTICSRAHAGLIEAKAARLIWHKRTKDDCIVPKEFWWARGEAALKQNWAAGDFETWIDREYHLLAYGVSFARAGIDAIVEAAAGAPREAPSEPAQAVPQGNAGGRPPAAWWDDLWVEMCRQLYVGDLKPNRQADIEDAMMKWAAANEHDVSVSTIRPRARKLWFAIEKEDRN